MLFPMDRRKFIAAAGAALTASRFAPRALAVAHRPLALPTPDQLAWQDLEVGMFIHFAPNTWQGVEQDNLSTPLSVIDPQELDTDRWAHTAVALGARYIVFVAKHSGGFCMWQTHTTDYGIRNTPWRNGRGDVLADVAASCRKFGLKLGVYLSPRDGSQHADTGGVCKTPAEQQKYNALYRAQLTEVLSNYGPMVEIWFDGSSVIPVGDILRAHAPHAMIFQGPHATIRWVGNEDGFAPYPAWNGISRADAATGIATALNSDPDGSVWMPNEVDVSILRPNWFWSEASQKNLLSLDALLEIYYRSVGRGAQLLLNLPPDRTGLFPKETVARAQQFGDEIRRRFGKSIAQTAGAGTRFELPLPSGAEIDTVVIEEDCARGERVRGYRIEGRSGAHWLTLGEGTAIGHKRIQPVPASKLDALRLVITESAAPAAIRRFAAFNTGTAPPPTWNAPSAAWAFDEAGAWKEYVFDVDISAKIDAATTYRLRFIPQSGWQGCADPIEHAMLLIDGIAQPKLIRGVTGASDSLLLTLPAVGQKVAVEGRLRCAASGTILLRKQ